MFANNMLLRFLLLSKLICIVFARHKAFSDGEPNKLEKRAKRIGSSAVRTDSGRVLSNLVIETRQRSSETRTAFICITGQLGRLELDNKIQTLIHPLQENGYNIDVALVLSKGKPHFTHAAYKEERFSTDEEVMEMLQGLRSVRVINGPNFSYEPLQNPNPPAIHYENLKRRDPRPFEDVFARAQNHVRMFDSYQRCWDIERRIAALSDPTNPHPPPQYDVYFRVRDDVGFEQPFNMTLVNDFVTFSRSPEHPKIMVVSDCRSMGGINDRMAMVSPAAAQDFFLAPYQVLAVDPYQGFGETGTPLNWKRVIGPEKILKNLYEASDIRIIQSKYVRGVMRIIRRDNGNEFVDDFHHSDTKKSFCPMEAVDEHFY